MKVEVRFSVNKMKKTIRTFIKYLSNVKKRIYPNTNIQPFYHNYYYGYNKERELRIYAIFIYVHTYIHIHNEKKSS